MKLIFNDESFSFELLRNVGFAVAAGSDIGECLSTASRIQDGDYESWYTEWSKTADRVRQIADLARDTGRSVSAKEAYQRASTYYRMAEFYLHTNPADPRILQTFHCCRDTFAEAAKFSPTWHQVEIPYDDTTLQGWFYVVDTSGEPRPTLIFGSGYDNTIEESYFAAAFHANKRGYNCLTFDGPGQGRSVREQNLHFRYDWEHVITQVVDYLETRPDVDRDRIALEGYSFGGFLAARAACFEKRIKALIQYNAVFDFGQGFLNQTHDDAKALYQVGDRTGFDKAVFANMEKDPNLRWAATQGMWAFGIPEPSDYVDYLQKLTLKDVINFLTIPVLLLFSENDKLLGKQPATMWENLHNAPKTLVYFTAYEGAEEHCQAGDYLLNAQRTFDWLDHLFFDAPEPRYPEGVSQKAAPGEVIPLRLGT